MFRSRPPDGTFNVAKSKNNLPKNRYTDVLCYDHSRVILSEMDNDKDSDYIHANFVDGYKQKNAFINTQGNTNKNILEEKYWNKDNIFRQASFEATDLPRMFF